METLSYTTGAPTPRRRAKRVLRIAALALLVTYLTSYYGCVRSWWGFHNGSGGYSLEYHRIPFLPLATFLETLHAPLRVIDEHLFHYVVDLPPVPDFEGGPPDFSINLTPPATTRSTTTSPSPSEQR